MGAPPDVVQAIAAAAPRELLEVWPENETAVLIFCAMGTQWSYAGMGGVPTGLTYASLPVVCRAHRRRLDADLLTRLRTIEAEALKAMLERRRG